MLKKKSVKYLIVIVGIIGINLGVVRAMLPEDFDQPSGTVGQTNIIAPLREEGQPPVNGRQLTRQSSIAPINWREWLARPESSARVERTQKVWVQDGVKITSFQDCSQRNFSTDHIFLFENTIFEPETDASSGVLPIKWLTISSHFSQKIDVTFRNIQLNIEKIQVSRNTILKLIDCIIISSTPEAIICIFGGSQVELKGCTIRNCSIILQSEQVCGIFSDCIFTFDNFNNKKAIILIIGSAKAQLNECRLSGNDDNPPLLLYTYQGGSAIASNCSFEKGFCLALKKGRLELYDSLYPIFKLILGKLSEAIIRNSHLRRVVVSEKSKLTMDNVKLGSPTESQCLSIYENSMVTGENIKIEASKKSFPDVLIEGASLQFKGIMEIDSNKKEDMIIMLRGGSLLSLEEIRTLTDSVPHIFAQSSLVFHKGGVKCRLTSGLEIKTEAEKIHCLNSALRKNITLKDGLSFLMRLCENNDTIITKGVLRSLLESGVERDEASNIYWNFGKILNFMPKFTRKLCENKKYRISRLGSLYEGYFPFEDLKEEDKIYYRLINGPDYPLNYFTKIYHSACPICLDETDPIDAVMTPCGHAVHLSCIVNMPTLKCPICGIKCFVISPSIKLQSGFLIIH
ncbi:MAG: hypothetical protein LBO02_01755 [Holosporaceae bacterium]|jgi:hypothetical protein|nr:hypothetical protein [Holosporaceae bacterium]